MAETERVCFVISPIGQPGTEVRINADDFLQFIVRECEAIARYNYKVLRADEINEPGRITVQVIKYIESADLVIADVTGGNANVYYELALCHALGKPLITCAELGTLLPFDTQDNRTIFYSTHVRHAKEAREILSQQINAVNTGGFVADNPIVGALDVIKLSGSGNSSERTLGLLLEKFDELSGRINAMDQRILQASRFAMPPSSNSGIIFQNPTVDRGTGGGLFVGTSGVGRGIVQSRLRESAGTSSNLLTTPVETVKPP